MIDEIYQQLQHLLFDDNLQKTSFRYKTHLIGHEQTTLKECGVSIYLASALELFQVKVKVSTESPNSKQRAQESGFVGNQSRTAGVLLMLSL